MRYHFRFRKNYFVCAKLRWNLMENDRNDGIANNKHF